MSDSTAPYGIHAVAYTNGIEALRAGLDGTTITADREAIRAIRDMAHDEGCADAYTADSDAIVAAWAAGYTAEWNARNVIALYEPDSSGVYIVTREGDTMTMHYGDLSGDDCIPNTLTRRPDLDAWEEWPSLWLAPRFSAGEGPNGEEMVVLIDGLAYLATMID